MSKLVKCSNAQETPSKEAFRALNVIVTETLIQQCHEYAEVRYFIDNINGQAYGSTTNKDEAIKMAMTMQQLLEA